MEIDVRISRVKELIAKREQIDAELASLLGMTVGSKKPQKCASCGEAGHTARTCRKGADGASDPDTVEIASFTRQE
jgi:hypothetical protein